jgi:hypothetical protein
MIQRSLRETGRCFEGNIFLSLVNVFQTTHRHILEY